MRGRKEAHKEEEREGNIRKGKKDKKRKEGKINEICYTVKTAKAKT